VQEPGLFLGNARRESSNYPPRSFTNLKQGGGSTFGVITSTTIKAFPSSPFVTVTIQIGTAPESEQFWDFSTYLLSQYPALSELGIGGYGTLSPNSSVNSTLYGGFAGIFYIPALYPTNTSSSLASAFSPIINHVQTTWPGQFQTLISEKTYPQFNDFFLVTSGPDYAGIDIQVGSRLLDAKALSGDLPALKKALKGSMAPGGLNPYLLSGKGVRDAVPRGGSDAVNPAWRTSLVHMSSSPISLPPPNTSLHDPKPQNANKIQHWV
jgi:hypothetical protein